MLDANCGCSLIQSSPAMQRGAPSALLCPEETGTHGQKAWDASPASLSLPGSSWEKGTRDSGRAAGRERFSAETGMGTAQSVPAR